MDGWRRAEDGAACDADHEPPALLKLPRQAMTYAARDPLWVGMERKEMDKAGFLVAIGVQEQEKGTN